MVVSVTHQKVSAIPDAGDASLVEPSDWNATHTVSGLATVATTGSASDLTTGTLPAAQLPLASSSSVGGVKVDGTTITASSVGVISAVGAPPTGAAGGGLTGTYPNPTVAAAPLSAITGFGTGVASALAVNVGTAGAFVVQGGALGTPSSGVATNLTGTAASLTAGNVTTNANLTGPITSVGNATAIASQTGTGSTFVMSASPAITGTASISAATFAGLATFSSAMVYGGVTLSSSVTGTGSMVLSAGPTLTGTASFAATVHAGLATFSSAMVYGGVTLSSSVTGTGSMVLSVGPTLTGTASFAATVHAGLATFSSAMVYGGVTLTAAVTGTGNMVLSASPSLTGTTTVTGLNATGTIGLAAGASAAAPMLFQSGTNLTTASAGAAEFDGTAFYLTQFASTRQLVTTPQMVLSSATYALASGTAVQKLFNVTTSGQVTLQVGAYQFESLFTVTGMSSVSATFGFSLGGGAALTQLWSSNAIKAASLSFGTTPTFVVSSAAATLTANNSQTAAATLIGGIIRVTSSGTVIPQINLTASSSSAVIGINSYFKVFPLGAASTFGSVGNWS